MHDWIAVAAAAGSLGNLTSLKELSLEYQALVGPLPDNLAASPKLRTLGIGFNSFIGSVPSSIGASTSLRDVTLMAANLSGSLPSFSGSLLTPTGTHSLPHLWMTLLLPRWSTMHSEHTIGSTDGQEACYAGV